MYIHSHRIIELLRLEKNLKTMKSIRQPNTTKSKQTIKKNQNIKKSKGFSAKYVTRSDCLESKITAQQRGMKSTF